MQDREYNDLLNYLLDKLKQLNAIQVTNDIRQLISNGKIVEMHDTVELKKLKIKKREVGKTRTLPLTPKEAFETAIKYLEHVIIDLPLYEQKITKAFGNNVVWKFDKGEVFNSVYTEEGYDLKNLRIDKAEIEKAKNEFKQINKYISE